MTILLAGLIALGTWLVVHEDVRIRQHEVFESSLVRMKVYAPIEEQHGRCRRTNQGPVFRDLEPPIRS